ncbi:MAG: hypothetical protein ONB23_09145 [candidate division KSB1 bacterium]|nr:hypothetical protein [candidate division KSB1 bacterium]
MKRRTSALVLLAGWVLLLQPFLLQAAGISGRVVNGTHDGRPVPGCPLYLLRFSRPDLGQTVLDSTRSDQQGQFRFARLTPDSGAVFVASARYLGVEYFSPLFQVLRPDTLLDLTVVVFDTTQEVPVLHVQMHHVFAERDTADYFVREVLAFHAVGNRTFVAGQAGHTLALSLPPQAYAFHAESGFDTRSLHIKGHTLLSDRPIAPGAHQLAYQYRLPLERGRFRFQRPIDYPTAIFSFFYLDPSLRAESAVLKATAPLVVRGRQYGRLVGENLKPGTEVDVALARRSLLRARALRWGVPLLLAVVLAGVSLLLFRYPKIKEAQKKEADPGVQRREQLLYEIAALDEAFEAGQLPEEEYTAKRKQLKDEVVRLTEQLRSSRQTKT